MPKNGRKRAKVFSTVRRRPLQIGSSDWVGAVELACCAAVSGGWVPSAFRLVVLRRIRFNDREPWIMGSSLLLVIDGLIVDQVVCDEAGRVVEDPTRPGHGRVVPGMSAAVGAEAGGDYPAGRRADRTRPAGVVVAQAEVAWRKAAGTSPTGG